MQSEVVSVVGPEVAAVEELKVGRASLARTAACSGQREGRMHLRRRRPNSMDLK